jgi:hypothetical protein
MKYIVRSPLENNQKRYAEGETVELSDEHAAALLALGRVELFEPAEPTEPAKGKGKGN